MTPYSAKYAKAVFELAVEQNVLVRVSEDLESITRVFHDQPILQETLASPSVPAHVKEAMMAKLWERRLASLSFQFLRLVVKNRRLGGWTDIYADFTALAEKHRGFRRAKIVVGRRLSEADLQVIAKGFSAHVGHQVILEQTVDPEVIGGVAIHLGHEVYDGTIRRRLADIRSHLLSLS